jgi:putative ABC transport system substrate-binding protein
MRRREFLAALGGASTWSMLAHAQQPAPVIGYLATGLRDNLQPEVRAFHEGLVEFGFVEGRNLAVEHRWSEGRYEQLAQMAEDLVKRQVALIVVTGVPAALAAKAATTSIPIVFVMGPDPVAFKLVASLNKPGGNLTGATFFTSTLAPKRLELLRELLPARSAVAFLTNRKNPRSKQDRQDMEQSARAFGWKLVDLDASNTNELDDSFAKLAPLGIEALVVGADPYFHGQADRFAALCMRYRVAAIFSRREYVMAGGLMAYGTRLTDTYRQAGRYAGRVLKGEQPATLPVLQPTTFELVINLKTANALSLKMPPTLLARADEVIE